MRVPSRGREQLAFNRPGERRLSPPRSAGPRRGDDMYPCRRERRTAGSLVGPRSGEEHDRDQQVHATGWAANTSMSPPRERARAAGEVKPSSLPPSSRAHPRPSGAANVRRIRHVPDEP